jgi:hypothetical protein
MVPIFSPRRRLNEALYDPEAIFPLFHYSLRGVGATLRAGGQL